MSPGLGRNVGTKVRTFDKSTVCERAFARKGLATRPAEHERMLFQTREVVAELACDGVRIDNFQTSCVVYDWLASGRQFNLKFKHELQLESGFCQRVVERKPVPLSPGLDQGGEVKELSHVPGDAVAEDRTRSPAYRLAKCRPASTLSSRRSRLVARSQRNLKPPSLAPGSPWLKGIPWRRRSRKENHPPREASRNEAVPG